MNRTMGSRTGQLTALLKSRSVVRFYGPDTAKFLQGLVTNDVARLGGSTDATASSPSPSLPTPNLPVVSFQPLYAALLTPQGRFLYDFFLYRPPSPRDRLDPSRSGPGPGSSSLHELLADDDSRVVGGLLQTLKRYRLRAKVDIEYAAGDFSCWQRFGGEIGKKSREEEKPEAANVGWGSGVDLSGMSASHGSDAGWQWFKDPRLDCLGFRGIFPSSNTPPLVEADKETNERNYLLWKMQLVVAEGSSEIPKGEAVPLEYNLAGLNAISFDKGCYVGQELIARTHHRGLFSNACFPCLLRMLTAKDYRSESRDCDCLIDYRVSCGC